MRKIVERWLSEIQDFQDFCSRYAAFPFIYGIFWKIPELPRNPKTLMNRRIVGWRRRTWVRGNFLDLRVPFRESATICSNNNKKYIYNLTATHG